MVLVLPTLMATLRAVVLLHDARGLFPPQTALSLVLLGRILLGVGHVDDVDVPWSQQVDQTPLPLLSLLSLLSLATFQQQTNFPGFALLAQVHLVLLQLCYLLAGHELLACQLELHIFTTISLRTTPILHAEELGTLQFSDLLLELVEASFLLGDLLLEVFESGLLVLEGGLLLSEGGLLVLEGGLLVCEGGLLVCEGGLLVFWGVLVIADGGGPIPVM